MTQTEFQLEAQFDPASPERWDADIALPAPRSNRPVTFMNRVEAAAMDGLVALVRLIGMDASSALFGRTMRFVGPRIGSVQKKGLRNLRLVYPDMSEADRREILAEVWENIGRIGAEMAHLDKLKPLETESRVDVEGMEILQELIRKGGPMIFFSGHFANWEVMAPTLFRAGLKAALIYRAYNNPLLDEKIIAWRARVMSRWQVPKGIEGSREVIRVLREGYALCLMLDQKLNTGIPVPFMGHEAMTAPAAARLALKFDAPLVPIQLIRTEGAHFKFICHEPLTCTLSGDATEDTKRISQAVNDKLEEFVRAHPGQWLWLHQRWPKEMVRDL